jgi:molecular chaperone GrpE
MSETRHTADWSGAARAAGDAPSGHERQRAQNEQAQGHADGREQAAAREAEQSPTPGAGQAPGDDGRSGNGGDARAREADEDALRGDVDELVAVAAQRDDYLALAQRTQADFENYRKRVAKESAAAHERGMVKLAAELLPALDNLDRALEEGAAAAARDGRDAPLLEGVRLVRSELHAALARMGIERFSPKGERFDPAEHEAMAQQPVPGATSGTVVEVFQPGYRLGGSVIRPARVLVAA